MQIASISNAKVPQLRFPGFSGEWAITKLGDIAKFSKGTNISKDDIEVEGKIKAIRYGELYTTYSETINNVVSATNLPENSLVFSQKNDVVIPASGETHIDIATAACVLHDRIALSGDINIIRTSNNGIFLSYYLNNKKKIDIARLAQGVSVIHLYNSNLKDLSLSLPSSDEQEKIAGFLTLVDDRITVVEQKIELLRQYKKGITQKIFSQKLRFKDENKKDYPVWQSKKLGEIATIKKGSQLNKDDMIIDGEYPVLNGGVNYSGYTNRYNVSANTITISEGGNSCGYVSFINEDFWSGGHLYTLKTKINQDYLYHFLKYKQKVIMKLRVGSGLPNIQKKDLEKLKILTPYIEEQQKIAVFLTSLDNKIKLIDEQLTQAKTYKKFLLQRMFV